MGGGSSTHTERKKKTLLNVSPTCIGAVTKRAMAGWGSKATPQEGDDKANEAAYLCFCPRRDEFSSSFYSSSVPTVGQTDRCARLMVRLEAANQGEGGERGGLRARMCARPSKGHQTCRQSSCQSKLTSHWRNHWRQGKVIAEQGGTTRRIYGH